MTALPQLQLNARPRANVLVLSWWDLPCNFCDCENGGLGAKRRDLIPPPSLFIEYTATSCCFDFELEGPRLGSHVIFVIVRMESRCREEGPDSPSSTSIECVVNELMFGFELEGP